ncbi:hypothetical protein CfE428DRAFT_0056 [Chthoniobacter flavus Ellin428]|uniref:Uncharacterized protein n=1 Tax=Chthoniobacter flavus Ellin428 TaxID=497964 RepID=B4CTN5_9BACT|nr:hypothetical protein [Chthoniobacter flavus]EDY21931.1 hypothetical protein CfE428DRAFT_0056 [Chthoniobacter flavus Ellin428]TCO89322.1 hypothetical protein EV701_11456 [Chthoniobacter flavus]
MSPADEIRAYAELRRRMHEALAAEHPEWIEPNGESPMLNLYDERLAELLKHLHPPEERAVA